MTKSIQRFLLAAALVAGAGIAAPADGQNAVTPDSNAALANAVRHQIVMYANYSIFDDVTIQVANGTVRLTGVVNQPYKKPEIEKLAKSVAGAASVQDDIQVLPTSFDDDRLRAVLARAIYGDPVLSKYANQPLKPIHILVDNGHVTLTGFVDSQFDKQIAGTRASSAGLSFGKIVNNLQVVKPSKT